MRKLYILNSAERTKRFRAIVRDVGRLIGRDG